MISVSPWFHPIHNPVDRVGLLLVVIGYGGWGVQPEGIPQTPEQVKTYMQEVKQAPGLSVPGWFHEFIDLMVENDNWKNAIYDEFVPRRSTLIQLRSEMTYQPLYSQ